MANELEDALRAAAAVGRAKANRHGNGSSNGVAQDPSPARKKKTLNKRRRRRSRSDSMVSDTQPTDDPVQRLEAFKARMFEVGKDAASVTFSSAPAKSGDDIMKVQWKKAKKLVGGRRAGEGDDDEDAVPQLTRAKVVKSQPVSGGVAVTPTANGAAKAGKKNQKKKNKKKNMTVELKVPQPTQPVKAAAPQQQSRRKKTAAPTSAKKPAPVSGVREDVSSESEDELPVATAGVKRATPTASVREDISSGSEDEPPAPAAPVVKKLTAKSDDDDEDMSSGSEDDEGPAPPAPVRVATRKAGATVTKPAVAATLTAKKMKTAAPTAATKAAAKIPPAKPTANAKPAPGPTPTRAPAAKPAASPVTKPRSGSVTNEDLWDLNSLVQNAVAKKKKAPTPRKASMSKDEQSDGDDQGSEDGDFDGKEFKDHRMHVFSQLIDEAARDQWELVEVGRLVRIFAAQWSHKNKKTARFLRRYCPELVSVDFLEGLNINLEPKQLIAIFDRGSGSQGVLLNKVASAIENNNISVQDDAFLTFLTSKTDPLASNQEVLQFVVPLLESMSKVKDVGVLLKAICQHWHVERTAALVQDILLTPVFDDLDGQHDEILADLPQLEGRIDFPSRMDAEDADENGNLKGLIAGDDSDLGESDAGSEDEKEDELGEVLSDEAEGEDSHAEDEVYEGETDSEEEREARERLSPPKRRRSRFILDEAEEDEDDEEAMEGEEDDFLAEDDAEESDDSSEDSDSDDDAPSKPQRKRLRRG